MTVAQSEVQSSPVADEVLFEPNEDPVVPNFPLRRFFFEEVTWEFYTETLESLDRSHQHGRVTYDRGRMEIMTVGRKHEIIKKCIGRLLETVADEAGIAIEGVGNVTCRRQHLERGLEPDECYYITSIYQGNDAVLDLEKNPPPDLAIEIEVSKGIGVRMSIYADLGVPELWRFDGAAVVAMELVGREYKSVDRSRFFPNLDMAEFSQFVVRAVLDQRNVVPEYRKLLRSRKGPSQP